MEIFVQKCEGKVTETINRKWCRDKRKEGLVRNGGLVLVATGGKKHTTNKANRDDHSGTRRENKKKVSSVTSNSI